MAGVVYNEGQGGAYMRVMLSNNPDLPPIKISVLMKVEDDDSVQMTELEMYVTTGQAESIALNMIETLATATVNSMTYAQGKADDKEKGK